MAVQSDFLVAINQIAAERGIDANEVLEAVKAAILTAFRREYPIEEENTDIEEEKESTEEGQLLKVDISSDTGLFHVYADKKVVIEVANPATQIGLEDAQKIEPKLKEGDHIEVDITPKGDFGRVAAQVAKQVILQNLREFEKEAVMEEFKDKMGQLDTGIIQRMDGDTVVVEIRRASAVMEAEDRIPGEFYRSGDRLKFLLKKIKRTTKGKILTVSRSDPDFLRALFELEVPELVSESVEIKAIAREAGSRSKVAVSSNVEGVDPIGSFVGQKGVRINAVMNELKVGSNEEKIDIILWDQDIKQFISNAFSPAQVVSVKINDEKAKYAEVVVPDDQLSLAIGREGQNVRLAAKLTGWRLDIQGETIKVNPENAGSEDGDAGNISEVKKKTSAVTKKKDEAKEKKIKEKNGKKAIKKKTSSTSKKRKAVITSQKNKTGKTKKTVKAKK
ncbi:transcription termination/antitermination protein NusA [Candidatus Dojkabacteria bacterium]|nr:transcription termination/antitermination protein NusA [Candidatus Dojkabacteria bacterium]